MAGDKRGCFALGGPSSRKSSGRCMISISVSSNSSVGGVSSSSFVKVLVDTPSSSANVELVQEFPWQLMQMVEHLIPTFLQVHLPAHPLVHLHETAFSTSCGAGSLVVGIGSRPKHELFQPHLRASNDVPFHVCSWWYTRSRCWSAAAFVGGKEARLNPGLARDLAYWEYLISSNEV